MRVVNINGRLHDTVDAGVPYDSRAVRFGFGIFETMLVIDGRIQLKELHWERLFNGVEQINLVMPELMTREWLEEEVMRTVRKNQLEKLCRVRLQLYAGRGGLFDGQNAWSEFIIDCQQVEPSLPQLNAKGFHLVYAENLAKSPNSISNLKSTNMMLYSLAARQATAKKVDNAIVFNTYGNPMETTLANIFCIKNDIIYTPPLSEGCVAGVMRKYLLQQLPAKGFRVEEQPLTTAFLENADAVFVTNALRRIKWIAQVESSTYKVDKVLEVYENVRF